MPGDSKWLMEEQKEEVEVRDIGGDSVAWVGESMTVQDSEAAAPMMQSMSALGEGVKMVGRHRE